MNLFLIKVLDSDHGVLEAEEARHAIKVLRHNTGDLLHGIDGKGNKYLAKIAGIDKREVRLLLLEKESNWGEKSTWLRLAISPLKARDRLEWAIEKAVELGVSEICPVICQRTVKTGFKPDRINAIMLSALKQCKRSYLPELKEVQPFSTFISSPLNGLLFIPWCEAEKPLEDYATDLRKSPETTLLIGPEGDFTEEEISLARQNKFMAVTLGENRLRTETAAIYGLSAVKWTVGW